MDAEEEQDVSSLCDIDNTMGTCLSWANCTSTGYIANWTEQNCQPESVKRYKDLMLTSLGNTMRFVWYLLAFWFNQIIKELLVLLASVSMSWCFRPSSTFTFAKTESEESLTESLVLQAIL